jgi:hypothetical protein
MPKMFSKDVIIDLVTEDQEFSLTLKNAGTSSWNSVSSSLYTISRIRNSLLEKSKVEGYSHIKIIFPLSFYRIKQQLIYCKNYSFAHKTNQMYS